MSRKRCFNWSPVCELIFFLLTYPHCDFGEVEKAMFQGVACHFELIFGLLTNPKFYLFEVEKALFQVLALQSHLILDLWIVETHFDIIFCFLTNRNFDLFQDDKASIQVAELHLNVISCLFTSTKLDFREVSPSHSWPLYPVVNSFGSTWSQPWSLMNFLPCS